MNFTLGDDVQEFSVGVLFAQTISLLVRFNTLPDLVLSNDDRHRLKEIAKLCGQAARHAEKVGPFKIKSNSDIAEFEAYERFALAYTDQEEIGRRARNIKEVIEEMLKDEHPHPADHTFAVETLRAVAAAKR